MIASEGIQKPVRPTEALGHILSCRVIPRQETLNLALHMAVDDRGERSGQIGLRINSVKLAGLDEGGDGRPVLGSSVMSSEERVLSIKGNRPNGALLLLSISIRPSVRKSFKPSQYLVM